MQGIKSETEYPFIARNIVYDRMGNAEFTQYLFCLCLADREFPIGTEDKNIFPVRVGKYVDIQGLHVKIPGCVDCC